MSDCKECVGNEKLRALVKGAYGLMDSHGCSGWCKDAATALQRRKSERRLLPQDQASAGNRRTTVDRRDGE